MDRTRKDYIDFKNTDIERQMWHVFSNLLFLIPKSSDVSI